MAQAFDASPLESEEEDCCGFQASLGPLGIWCLPTPAPRRGRWLRRALSFQCCAGKATLGAFWIVFWGIHPFLTSTDVRHVDKEKEQGNSKSRTLKTQPRLYHLSTLVSQILCSEALGGQPYAYSWGALWNLRRRRRPSVVFLGNRTGLRREEMSEVEVEQMAS